MYNPLKYFTSEVLKNISDRAKEIMTFLYPPITMYERNGEIVIEADMPGFEKKNITVRMDRNSISISGEREIEAKGNVYMDQRPEKVQKRIRLPLEVDPDVTFTAKYNNGVLTIVIPAKGIRTIKVE
ncbi:MAG TPA: archaeal heat shock protein Hsp14 [Thermoplasmataceae archaeon]|nr:Hsp20/alpha crystallin family protein [Thermoplasmatales archaeon AK]HLH86411.1 archaeal heat shock protein Hsp14 [Thermoplasmataceae archaeon]